MTNLPISANIAPSPSPGKTASADDAQGASGFGDVMARQVADAAPADKNTASNATDKKVDTASTDAAPPASLEKSTAALVPDVPNALPTEMLAALLAQQSQQGAAQSTINLQMVVNNQQQPGTSAMSLEALIKKDSPVPHLVLNEKSALPQAKLPAMEGQQLAASAGQQQAAAKDNQAFSGVLTALGKNNVIPPLDGELTRKIKLTDIAATAQQSGALAAAQAATTAIGTKDTTTAAPVVVNTPLTQAGWDHEFSQKITWLATQRDQSAELHLNPPQLGPLDVVIKVSADQATALFTSPHAAVREAIEQALPKLREMLAENGIMLGNATVGDHASRQEKNDFSRSQPGAESHSGSVGGVTAVASTSIRNATRHNGMVDTFA